VGCFPSLAIYCRCVCTLERQQQKWFLNTKRDKKKKKLDREQ
jgi:hypothetical protein